MTLFCKVLLNPVCFFSVITSAMFKNAIATLNAFKRNTDCMGVIL